MSEEELIRLYKLMDKLKWFFHNEMHYLDKSISEKMALECYPEIREFTYDIYGMSTCFMCTSEAAEKLIDMNYDNLTVKETNIMG